MKAECKSSTAPVYNVFILVNPCFSHSVVSAWCVARDFGQMKGGDTEEERSLGHTTLRWWCSFQISPRRRLWLTRECGGIAWGSTLVVRGEFMILGRSDGLRESEPSSHTGQYCPWRSHSGETSEAELSEGSSSLTHGLLTGK